MSAWHESTFPSMGSTASVVVDGPPRLLARARAELERLERAWSRFMHGSEITRLNSAGGLTMTVSEDTVTLIRAMVDAWRATDGAFDPTMLAALVHLGYDQSRTDTAKTTRVAPVTAWRDSPDLIVIDDGRRTVQLPPRMAIDPGGIGKGLAADIVADLMITDGAAGALVDVGGDIAVRGSAPAVDGWHIAVGDDDGEHIRLATGGVATSGTELHSWVDSTGEPVHHLLDPGRMAPVVSPLREVTVIAGTATWAEAWTKAVMMSPVAAVMTRLDRMKLAVRVRLDDGSIERNHTWNLYPIPKVTS
jgi:thiamine biosynthesis lipoprotein